MAEHLTKEQTKARIQALLRERQSYVLYGNNAQVADVDKELDRLGHQAKPPAERATRMKREGSKKTSSQAKKKD